MSTGSGAHPDGAHREPGGYEPIDCSFHDRLEAAATLRRTVGIAYRDENGELQEIEDRLVDVFAREGAEFVRLAGGPVIRLDRLVSVNGFRLP